MTADSIIQLITVLLGSGGLITIFLISEKKTAAMPENMAKANEEWKKLSIGRPRKTRRSAASSYHSLFYTSRFKNIGLERFFIFILLKSFRGISNQRFSNLHLQVFRKTK